MAMARGEGSGNGGNSGNTGGSAKSGGSSKSASAGAAGKNAGTGGKSAAAKTAGAVSKKAAANKQLALTDPAHPKMLGRWNATKPVDHPAIQAHIRNGNFNGTIGMIAAYAQAQTTYNGLEAGLAAAAGVVKAGQDAATLAAALAAAGYVDLAAYDAAVLADPALTNAAIDAARTTLGTQTVPTAEEIAAAEAVLQQGQEALAGLATAEANMAAYSNRAPWGEIRDDVRERMGLDPAEDDLAPVAPATVQ